MRRLIERYSQTRGLRESCSVSSRISCENIPAQAPCLITNLSLFDKNINYRRYPSAPDLSYLPIVKQLMVKFVDSNSSHKERRRTVCSVCLCWSISFWVIVRLFVSTVRLLIHSLSCVTSLLSASLLPLHCFMPLIGHRDGTSASNWSALDNLTHSASHHIHPLIDFCCCLRDWLALESVSPSSVSYDTLLFHKQPSQLFQWLNIHPKQWPFVYKLRLHQLPFCSNLFVAVTVLGS